MNDFKPFVRLMPRKAPFRRAGIEFKTLDPVILPLDEISAEQALLLVEEPLVDVDQSRDGGDSWRRFSLPSPAEEATSDHSRDPALSPERAVDPSRPLIVPGSGGLGVAPPAPSDGVATQVRAAPVDRNAPILDAPVALGGVAPVKPVRGQPAATKAKTAAKAKKVPDGRPFPASEAERKVDDAGVIAPGIGTIGSEA